MTTKINYVDDMLDISTPQLVDVQFNAQNKLLYINIDRECALRVSHVAEGEKAHNCYVFSGETSDSEPKFDMLDITNPKLVEVLIDPLSKRIWVNIDGKCAMRISQFFDCKFAIVSGEQAS